jgi:hypothetical protein
MIPKMIGSRTVLNTLMGVVDVVAFTAADRSRDTRMCRYVAYQYAGDFISAGSWSRMQRRQELANRPVRI